MSFEDKEKRATSEPEINAVKNSKMKIRIPKIIWVEIPIFSVVNNIKFTESGSKVVCFR